MRRLAIAGALTALALALVPAAPAPAKAPYSGAMTIGAGPVREASQGAYWVSRFRASERRRMTYTACGLAISRTPRRELSRPSERIRDPGPPPCVGAR